MQTDRVAYARLVRRRKADMKIAEDLRSRGWTVSPPIDEMQVKIERDNYLKEGTTPSSAVNRRLTR